MKSISRVIGALIPPLVPVVKTAYALTSEGCGQWGLLWVMLESTSYASICPLKNSRQRVNFVVRLLFAVLRYQQFELNRGRRWRERIRTTSLPRQQPVKDGMGHCAPPPHLLPR